MARFSVLTLNNISAKGLSRLPADVFTHSSHEATPDAVLVRSHDMHSMAIPASVLALGRAGAGTNNIPVKTMT